jgi:hypothetical protein
MWVIYLKKDRKIVGLSADCEIDLPKESAIGEVVKGLINQEPLSKYDALQVRDREQGRALLHAPRESVVLHEVAKGDWQVAIEEPKQSFLLLNCDAPDVHPADGIPEIKADGEAFTTITVQKTDELGVLLQGKGDTDQFYLRTDYGSLLSADGKAPINSLKLKKGQAAFRLVSEKARRVATVQVFNADTNVLDGTIRIEFI